MYSLVVTVLKDKKVTPDEVKFLTSFFSQFIDSDTKEHLALSPEDLALLSKKGICSLNPEITIEERCFCFTGKSSKTTRAEIADFITSRGGTFHDNVKKATDYLIIGDEGNPCWAFSCYGRKVEKAIELRKRGSHIMIVSEIDFWDTVE